MRILAVGDVTSPAGVEHLATHLWEVRRRYAVDFCIVNVENASLITGASPEQAELLLRSGADVLTGGNHTLRNRAIYTALDDTAELLRPLNFGAEVAGHGYVISDTPTCRVMVINAMGNVHMEPTLDSPYGAIDRLLAREAGNYDIAVLDLHAEATGEKLALAFAYDGRLSVVFGTHTHVPTADLKILPKGTGYVSDLGMCGESGGVLGMDPETVVRRMRTHLPERFLPATGKVVADGVIFTVDEKIGKTTACERIAF